MDQTPSQISEEFEESLIEEILIALYLLQATVDQSLIKSSYLLGDAEQVVDTINWDDFKSSLSSIITILMTAYLKGGNSAYEESGSKYSKLDITGSLSALFMEELQEMIDELVEATKRGSTQAVQLLLDQSTSAGVAAPLIVLLLGNTQQTVSGILNTRRAMLASGTPVKVVKESVNSLAEKGLLSRSDLIADNEAYGSVSRGRSDSWIQWAVQGKIAFDATKTWFTKADEFVCPVCAPLHLNTIRVGEAYPGGILNAPAHPRCRCHERLN